MRLQEAERTHVIGQAVDAADFHAHHAGTAGIQRQGVALGEIIGGAVGAAGDDLAGIGFGDRPARQFRAVLPQQPPRRPAADRAVHLADQHGAVAVTGIDRIERLAVEILDRRQRGLVGGTALRHQETDAAFQAAVGQGLDHIQLLRGHQTRPAAVIDGQPQHRFRPLAGPVPVTGGGNQRIDRIGIEADPQRRFQYRRAADQGIAFGVGCGLIGVAGLHPFRGIGQRAADDRIAAGIGAAGQLIDDLHQSAGIGGVARRFALRQQFDGGAVQPGVAYRTFAFDRRAVLGARGRRRFGGNCGFGRRGLGRRRGLRGKQAGTRHQQRKQGDTDGMAEHHGGILPQFMGFCTVYYR